MNYKSYLVEQNLASIKENITLLFGENLGFKNDLKNKIKLENKKSEIINYTQEEILKDSTVFFNNLTNISLFENNKIFFINNANDKLLPIIEEVEKFINDQRIYIFSEVLDKRSKLRNYFEKSRNCAAIACYPDNEIGIKKIINEELKGYVGLNAENLNLITENSSLDRSKLKNELEKIKTYFTDKKIEFDNLKKLLNVRENESFDKLRDLSLNGDKTRTNKLLSDTNFDLEKSIFYLSSINHRLDKLNQINKIKIVEKNLEKAIENVKPPIFWKDKPNFMTQAKKWNEEKIRYVLDKTYKLEIKLKSNSTINKNILIKMLLVDICRMANV